MWEWLITNKQWVFSGIGVAIATGIIAFFVRRSSGISQNQTSGTRSTNIQSAGDISINNSKEKPGDR